MVPRELKYRLLKYSAVDRFKNVGLLKETNFLLKHTLTKQNLKCIAAGFNYQPKNLAGVMILQSETAVRNFNKKYDVDNYGKRKRSDTLGYRREKRSIITPFYGSKKISMGKMSCPYSCSRSGRNFYKKG
uniref:Ribosomal protein S18 n=1 Tax=Strongyloides venezuelensis TaxID=75913 RepID=A0A0K0FI24_STRVS